MKTIDIKPQIIDWMYQEKGKHHKVFIKEKNPCGLSLRDKKGATFIFPLDEATCMELIEFIDWLNQNCTLRISQKFIFSEKKFRIVYVNRSGEQRVTMIYEADNECKLQVRLHNKQVIFLRHKK
jgi:hypothetical protein